MKLFQHQSAVHKLALSILLILAPALGHAADLLVPAGSVWRFLDDGSNQGTAWRQAGFDDSAWTAGPAQLGYGDGDEATVVSFGPDGNNKHITTYFRHVFTVSDPAPYLGASLRLLRDDGAVVHLNGTEIFRSNMPDGTVNHTTVASTAIGGAQESTFYSTTVDPALLVSGANVLAVEVHQANVTSSDISFDLELTASTTVGIVRGPYLQRGTPTSALVRWRTDAATDSRVWYGMDPANLNQMADHPEITTEHQVTLTGLSPATRYHYAIGTSAEILAAEAGFTFVTAPSVGTVAPVRIWAIGDSGTADAAARRVRDAYTTHTGTQEADVWLMLGDNAYNDGTDAEYQAAVFDMYPAFLSRNFLWPTLGNHDGHTADSSTESGPYYDIFTLPALGEAGGLASGTEAYYSFDYANIHFVCLDSYESDRSVSGPMLTWLQNDLASTTQEWIVAFWHHPPYSKGSHDSDTEASLTQMRQNALPILEQMGVDLVLTGHSHSYERSFLLDGHYGTSGTLSQEMVVDGGSGRENGDGAYEKAPGLTAHQGAVYAVAGSSGKTSGGPLNHPAMFISLNVLGSMVIDISGNRLDAVFLDDNASVEDYFTIIKATASPTPPAAPSDLAASPVSSSEIGLAWSDNSSDETGFEIERSPDGLAFVHIATVGANITSGLDAGLDPSTTYFYRARAVNDAGTSDYSNIADAQTLPPPPAVDDVAAGELAVAGSISGSYQDTWADDGVSEALTERESGGKPDSRHSFLEHKWLFDVTGGESVTLFLNAHHSVSTDGDEFLFAYSTDDTTYTDMLLVTKTADDGLFQSYNLPNSLNGTVYIRVKDTDQTVGNRSLDTLFVDQIFIRSENASVSTPPAAPSALAANALSSTSIGLAWTDNASDEYGFEIERSEDGIAWTKIADASANATTFTDASLSPDTTRFYRVRAYNGAGPSDFSNTTSATTPPASVISLTASGYKVRGLQHADLQWTGANTASVIVYRDGQVIAITPNSGSYTDNIGAKGGGAYHYQVCEDSGSPCSEVVPVVF